MPRPGAVKTATTGDNMRKAHDLLLADRRLKTREIADTVGISKESVSYILHEILGMRRLSNKSRNSENTSHKGLTLFKRNPRGRFCGDHRVLEFQKSD